ncbi:MAG: histidine kinase [Acidimicrobiales bacterium]
MNPSEDSWERARTLALRWLTPLTESKGWLAVLYLLVGGASAVAFFVIILAMGALVFGLSFAIVGLFLVRPFFALAQRLTGAERAMAQWVGVQIESRPIAPLRRLGYSALADPERWRQVAFLVLNLLIGTTLSSVGLAAYWLVYQLVLTDPSSNGDAIFGLGPLSWLVGLAIAAVALGAAPRIAFFVATLKARSTAWFLGPDQLAAAEARVHTLAGQRQDVLDAVAIERRRIERNLHDGVQQQLVAIGLDLGMAEQHLGSNTERARQLIVSAREKVQGSIGELRQLGRGLHPAILADRGIDAALSAVVANSPIPISVHVDPQLDLSTDVAETVYFVANESLANVLKHARARVASVQVSKVAANVRITVHDDGRGGADPARGSGIAGIRARVAAVDGTLTISSPPGGPTVLVAEIPRQPAATIRSNNPR